GGAGWGGGGGAPAAAARRVGPARADRCSTSSAARAVSVAKGPCSSRKRLDAEKDRDGTTGRHGPERRNANITHSPTRRASARYNPVIYKGILRRFCASTGEWRSIQRQIDANSTGDPRCIVLTRAVDAAMCVAGTSQRRNSALPLAGKGLSMPPISYFLGSGPITIELNLAQAYTVAAAAQVGNEVHDLRF